MAYHSAPWTQLPNETGEAYSAFRFYFYVGSRDIDRAWRKFTFPPNHPVPPDDPLYLAPPQWHIWHDDHNWPFRASEADAEERQLAFEAAEKEKGNAISWIAERQDDFRDRLLIYKNLRRGLVQLTECGQLLDRTTKTVTRVSENRWETVIETVRATEQIKYLERNGPLLFPADNSKPMTPSGQALFIDLDLISEISPYPPPVRDRYQPRSIWRHNPVTNQQELVEI